MSMDLEGCQLSPEVFATGVKKVFTTNGRSVVALERLEVSVEPGEFLSIIGGSGCGKSTLLHLLGGLDLPNGGEIIFDGEDLRALAASALARSPVKSGSAVAPDVV